VIQANQAAEIKYVTLIDNVLTKQWCLDKALAVARGRMGYKKVLPKQRKAVETFISVFVNLPAGYSKSLSQLPSIVFSHLSCSILFAYGVVPHHHTPSTELILLHVPMNKSAKPSALWWCTQYIKGADIRSTRHTRRTCTNN